MNVGAAARKFVLTATLPLVMPIQTRFESVGVAAMNVGVAAVVTKSAAAKFAPPSVLRKMPMLPDGLSLHAEPSLFSVPPFVGT